MPASRCDAAAAARSGRERSRERVASPGPRSRREWPAAPTWAIPCRLAAPTRAFARCPGVLGAELRGSCVRWIEVRRAAAHELAQHVRLRDLLAAIAEGERGRQAAGAKGL